MLLRKAEGTVLDVDLDLCVLSAVGAFKSAKALLGLARCAVAQDQQSAPRNFLRQSGVSFDFCSQIGFQRRFQGVQDKLTFGHSQSSHLAPFKSDLDICPKNC